MFVHSVCGAVRIFKDFYVYCGINLLWNSSLTTVEKLNIYRSFKF